MARIRPLKRIQPPADPAELVPFVRKLQDNIAEALEPIPEVVLLDGVHRRDVALTAGTVNRVSHGLGRSWRGCIVTRKNAVADVYQPDEQQLRERTCDIQCTANVVVDLYFF